MPGKDEVDGYKVVIYSGSQREIANKKKKKFELSVKRTRAYLEYVFPNYKLLVGDYREKRDAEKAKVQFRKFFGNAIYVVKAKVNIPYLE